MGQYDHIIDWFKKRHDALVDDLESLKSGRTRLMDHDGSDWNDVTPRLIVKTREQIEEMQSLVKKYQERNRRPFRVISNRD